MVLLAWVAAGCGAQGNFQCNDNSECVLAGATGTCEANGYCSFPDGECSSGQLYGECAPAGIGGRCAPRAAELPAAPAGTTDAAPGTPDAAPVPDAAPGEPDASRQPDAGGCGDVTVSFGETGGTTYSGVTIDTWI